MEKFGNLDSVFLILKKTMVVINTGIIEECNFVKKIVLTYKENYEVYKIWLGIPNPTGFFSFLPRGSVPSQIHSA